MIQKYKIVTLCGSTRFKEQFLEVQKRLTLDGCIVISVGLFGHSGDNEVWKPGTKEMLDDMHLRKIDLADEIFVINVGGYIGDSTRREIAYAEKTEKKINYLKDLFETVYLADIIERHNIKNENEMRELVLILASSIGAPCNPTKLSNTFKSVKNVSIGSQTISNYLTFLSESFLLNRAIRYDIKGKKYINTLSKYYFSDIGLRNAILDMRQQEETHIMENIIYNELLVRGYSVDVGMVEIKKQDKNGKWVRIQLEVDFIASLGSKKYYVQSALSIPDREKETQETRPLTNINDSFKKVIIVKDHIMPRRNEEGILTIGLFDFLLKEDSLDLTELSSRTQ